MNKRIRIAFILIAIILIASLAISLAYSRYFSKITGTGTATVAKWSFKVNGQSDNLGQIKLGNTLAENSKVADGKLAPGTFGSFNVKLDATGTEVALDYTIKLENFQGNKPTNLKFYKTKTQEGQYQDEISDITTVGLTGNIGVSDEKTKTVTIYWKWDYRTGSDDSNQTANDTVDTQEGQTAPSITFDVVVTGTQQENV